MAKRDFLEIVDAPKGYELNPEKGWFGVITPHAKTNFIANPSFETNLTGYTLVGAGWAQARSATYQRRGVWSNRLTPAAGVQGTVYYAITLTAGTKYTWSFDFRGIPGEEYYFRFTTAALAATLRRSPNVIGDGHWHRYVLEYTPTATVVHDLAISNVASPSVQPFYTDGWQLEEGDESTYLDGDMVGFVLGQVDYRWNGTAHASTSYRSGQTRSGGDVMNFKNLGVVVMTVVGLGLAPVENISTPLAKGGEFYQDTIWNAREFSIMGEIQSKTLQGIQQIRGALNRAFTPDATVEKQPLVIRYTPYDCENQFGDTVDIQCSYAGGLEGNVDNRYQEKLVLNFKQYLPLILKDGNNALQLGYQTAIANASPFIQRNPDTGVWDDIDTNWSNSPEKIRRFSNGDLLIVGAFGTINGVTFNGVARWNGTALAPYVVGANIGVSAGAVVYDAVILPDDTFIIVGSFALAGGVVNTSRIARWNGATWVAYGTGLAGGANIGYGVVADASGYPTVTGDFATANGVAALNIARWTGATFVPFGVGLNAVGLTLLLTKTNVLWVGGQFTTANGVTVNAVTYWNGATFVALGTGLAIGIGILQVYTLEELNNNDIVIGGQFDTANGIASRAIVVWNGTVFIAKFGPGAVGLVGSLYNDEINNVLYIGGNWTAFGGTAGISNTIKVVNVTGLSPTIVPIDCYATVVLGFNTIRNVSVDPVTGVLSMVGLWRGLGNTLTYPTATANNIGEAYSYPKITITGPGTLWQILNNTTKRGLYFSGLTLALGETVTINFDPTNVSLISSSRGDISGYLLPGSDLDFFLQPGANYITFFMYGGTGVTTDAYMIWNDALLSIDGAVW